MTNRWLGLLAMVGVGCTDAALPDEAAGSADLGGTATVFALAASSSQGWSLRVQEDRVANASGVTLHTTIVLGPRNPNGPEVTVHYNVTAADAATASGGGLLVGLAWAGGVPVQQAVQILAQSNIALSITGLAGTIAAPPPDLGVLIGLGDAALHAVGPGGGCIVFHAAAQALQLPDGCVHGPAPSAGGGGPLFSLEAVGATQSFKVTQTDVSAPGGPARIATKYALGIKAPGPPQLQLAYTVDGGDELTTSVGALLLGLGVIADRGVVATTNQLAQAQISLQVESLTITAPQPAPFPVDALADLVDFGIAADRPGGGCITFDAGASVMQLALRCAQSASGSR